MKKILHTSDSHGKNISLPKGAFDLFVDTGDFCAHSREHWHREGPYGQWHLNREGEAEWQAAWFQEVQAPRYAAINATHKLIIPGNHDFLPAQTGKFSYVSSTSTIVLGGIKIGVLLGCNIVKASNLVGPWQDEVSEYEFRQRIMSLDPDIDILVSHQPPNQILDLVDVHRIGSNELYKAIFGGAFGSVPPYFTKLRLHLFGHVHEHSGVTEYEMEGRKITFSNAAKGNKSKGFNVIDLP
jgi:Icc-related predicted phosphoesterase